MPRKAATIEHLERLLEWVGNRETFERLTGIEKRNLSAYLKGTKAITWKRLLKCSVQVFGNPAFVAVLEGHDYMAEGLPTKTEDLVKPGIYALYDSAMRVIYYGKATNLHTEIGQTLRRPVAEVRPWTGAKNLIFADITAYISAYTINRGDPDFRHDVETLLHKLFVNNTFNRNSGNFKRQE